MTRALRVATALLVAALFGLLVYRFATEGPGSRLSTGTLRGRPKAPNVHLRLIWRDAATWPVALKPLAARRELSLRELSGRPVVVNLWASWCDPCKREAARLVAAAKTHRGTVVFLGVDLNDFTGDARRFLERQGVNYVSVRGGASTAEAFGLVGLPETYYIDSKGRVAGRTVGEVSARQLERGIQRAGSD